MKCEGPQLPLRPLDMNKENHWNGNLLLMPYATLSFADRSTKCLWLPYDSSDIRRRNSEGRRRATELVAFMQHNSMPFLLGHVITEISKQGEMGALETGFMHQIARFTMNINLSETTDEAATERPRLTLVT